MTQLRAALLPLRSGRGELTPARARELLESLGPTFVKIGQYLSLRSDLIPEEYATELLQLVDAVPPMPFAAARTILDADLGERAADLVWLNPHPVGAASLAQVHQAQTADGRKVAVKIQREGAPARVRKDLGRIRLVGRIVGQIGLTPGVSVRDVIAELERWMEEELDFRHELRNLVRMHEFDWDASHARIPEPYPDLSGDRVVTAEYLTGVPFSEILRLVREGNDARVAELDLDLDVLAENLLETVLAQIFRFQLFQADTHPGNLIAIPGNVIGFVDFGLVETLDETFRGGMLHYLRAVYSGDVQGMLRGLLEVLVAGPSADVDGFRSDFLEETRRWRRERGGPSAPGARTDSPATRYLTGVLSAARKNGLLVPAGVLSMYRSLLTAETVAAQLGAAADLGSVGRRFFTRLELESLQAALEPEEQRREAVQLFDLLRTSPGKVQRLLSDLADDRFVLRVQSTDAPETRRRGDLRARLVSVAVVSVGIAILLAGSKGVQVAGVPVRAVLWVVLGCTYAYLAALWRRLR